MPRLKRLITAVFAFAVGLFLLLTVAAAPAQASANRHSEGNWYPMGRDFFTYAQCWHAHYRYMPPSDNGRDWKCELNGWWHPGQTYTLWIYFA